MYVHIHEFMAPGKKSQGRAHACQVFCHWALSSVLIFPFCQDVVACENSFSPMKYFICTLHLSQAGQETKASYCGTIPIIYFKCHL